MDDSLMVTAYSNTVLRITGKSRITPPSDFTKKK